MIPMFEWEMCLKVWNPCACDPCGAYASCTIMTCVGSVDRRDIDDLRNLTKK